MSRPVAPRPAAAHSRRTARVVRAALLALGAAATTGVPFALGAQDSVVAARTASAPSPSGGTLVIRDLGPGQAGRVLQRALAAPHDVYSRSASDSTLRLPRYATLPRAVVVIGGDVSVGSTVRGDVIVIDGDLYLHPGAIIEGRAIVFGGGLYNSTLATVRGERILFRDVMFDATPGTTGTIDLAYREIGGTRPRAISFPVYGLRTPTYDRINGLSVGVGPTIWLDTGRYEIDPTLTYRSHLGDIDPSVSAAAHFGRLTDVRLFAGRDTRTNDGWNRSDIANSFTSFLAGTDTRNYYRADRADLRAVRRWEREFSTFEGYAGGATERAWSVERDGLATSAPFSILNENDRLRGMLRSNPAVDRGRISSLLAGGSMLFERPDMRTSGGIGVEGAFDSPQTLSDDVVFERSKFVQITLDAATRFPTFGSQTFELAAHAVVTAAGDGGTPRQRYAYLGGSGTIVTDDLLNVGGDQLFFVESQYTVPIERVTLPFIGVPAIALRHAIGGAAVGEFPDLVQNVGVRLILGPLRLDFSIDPESRRTRTSASPNLFR